MNPILFNRADFPQGRTTFLPRPLDRTWHQIEVAGEHPGLLNHERVTQAIDRTALEMIVDAFETDAGAPHFPGLLVDADHLSHHPEQRTEAMGWLKNVEIRDDGQLWGEIQWTDAGATAVSNRRYQFFSTEYDAGDLTDLGAGRVRPGRLAGLALTNRPNNRGGRPISNRKGDQSPEPNPTQQASKQHTMKNIATQLGLPEEATEEQIAAAIGTIQNRAAKADTLEADAQAEAILNTHEKRIAQGTRDEWKANLIANREATERLLLKMPEIVAAPEEKAEGRPAITNRATAKVPGAEQAHGSSDDLAGKQQAAVLRIQNREKCKFTRAWDIARLEEPSLFSQN